MSVAQKTMNIQKSKINKFNVNLGVLPAICVFILLNVPKLPRFFTTDEVWNVRAIKLPWNELFTTIVNDYHPPLHFFLEKAYSLVFGLSETSLHISSMLFAIGVIFVFYKLMLRYFSLSVSIACSLIFALNPLFLSQAIYVRYYSFLAFLTILSYYFFLKIIENGVKNLRLLLALAIINSLALFTHYLAIEFVGLQIATFFILRFRRQKFISLMREIVILLSPILFFLMWLPIFIDQFNRGGIGRYLDDFKVLERLYYVAFNYMLGPVVFFGRFLLFALALIVIGGLIIRGFVEFIKDNRIQGFVLASHFIIIAILLAVNNNASAFYALFINFMLLFFLMFGIFTLSYPRRFIAILALMLVLALPIANFISNREWHIANATDDWPRLLDYLIEHQSCAQNLVDNSGTLGFYLDKANVKNYKFIYSKDEDLLQSDCTILVRTYGGFGKQSQVIFNDAYQKLLNTMKIADHIEFSKDPFAGEKSKLTGGVVAPQEYRIEIVRFKSDKNEIRTN